MVFYVYNTNRVYTAKIADTLGVLQVKSFVNQGVYYMYISFVFGYSNPLVRNHIYFLLFNYSGD